MDGEHMDQHQFKPHHILNIEDSKPAQPAEPFKLWQPTCFDRFRRFMLSEDVTAAVQLGFGECKAGLPAISLDMVSPSMQSDHQWYKKPDRASRRMLRCRQLHNSPVCVHHINHLVPRLYWSHCKSINVSRICPVLWCPWY